MWQQHRFYRVFSLLTWPSVKRDSPEQLRVDNSFLATKLLIGFFISIKAICCLPDCAPVGIVKVWTFELAGPRTNDIVLYMPYRLHGYKQFMPVTP